MTKFVALDDPAAIDATVRVLAEGGAVVVPTDTVYGLAALAPDRLYALKDRPASVPIATLVDSIDQARTLVRMTGAAASVAAALWPGPLTIVFDRLDGDGTLGVRCPDHAFMRAVAARVGPVPVTSANRHGEATPATAAEAAGSLAGAVDLVIDGGPSAGQASTVVDGTAAELVVLRAGPITEEQLRAAALR